MNKQVNNKRKVQAMETKNKIYEMAIELIGKYGYDNVSIDEICEKANVSKGTFYHHFNAKEDVIIAFYQEEYEDFFNSKNFTAESTLEEITEVIIFHVKYSERKGLDIVKQTYKSQLDYGSKLLLSKNILLHEKLREIIEKGQENGEIRKDKESVDIINYLIRLSHGIIYDWCLNNGSYSIEEITRMSLNCIMETLRPH